MRQQGDGEVCGTAIESPMRSPCIFDLIKQTPLAYPRLGPQGRSPPLDAKGMTSPRESVRT